MTPELVITIALGFLIANAGAFYLGWELSVRRFNAQRHQERAHVRQLENDVDDLAEQLQRDDVRVGINTGKEYVTHRVQSTLDDIRSESR